MAQYVKTFTASNKGYKTVKLPGGGTPGTPQSMAILPGNVIAVFHNKNNAGGTAYCRKYTKKGYVKGSQKVNHNLGHCNGATYCEKNGLIYCTGYNNGRNTHRVVALDTNFNQKFMFNLPVAVSGLAYDRTVDKFYASRGKNVYVFPFSAFQSSHRTKSYRRYTTASGTSQDMGGYNGIIYKFFFYHSWGKINMYKHSTGKYLGSIKVSYSETESCVFDTAGNFIYLTANQNRAIHWTNWKPPYSDGAKLNITPKPTTPNKESAAKRFLNTAKKELGTKETGNNTVKYSTWYNGRKVSGNKYAWCSEFVAWCGWKTFGNNKIIPKKGEAHALQKAIVAKGGKWIIKENSAKTKANAAKCQPGDILTFDYDHDGDANHICIIEYVKGKTFHTIEGNHHGKVCRDTRKFDGKVFRVARPNWAKEDGGTAGGGGTYGDSSMYGEGELVLQVNPDQLYSSENFKYLQELENEETEEQKKFKAMVQSNKDFLLGIDISKSIRDGSAIPDIKLKNIKAASNYKKPRTKVEGDIRGATLPSTINYVEAPYGKITIGGVTIGSYTKKSYPNYLNSITVKKTNGSLNEYVINLTHQIYPGDNPNYIDNLISKNGYTKIQIEYGDAEAGISYRDINALLINATSKFDFFNNSISYTLYATSSSVMATVNKRNYSAVKAKPSTLINKMIYDTGELLEYFPGMSNKSFVNSNSLIPSNDKEVEIEAMQDTTPLNYLNKLISVMTSDQSSVYYMSIDDNSRNESYFKIKEIKTDIPASYFPLVYEIDINYPNENSLVYNFSVDTDYSWPLAYEYAGRFANYNYDIDNAGNISSKEITSNLQSIASTEGVNVSDKNWWTNVTEFPITATLEIKGITTYTLLLNYIKVNVLYFGQKRNSSGVYIVTGQEDSLSGNGFVTRLSLLRVAGDDQYINVDGRVITAGK